jgi:hypothetical protein
VHSRASGQRTYQDLIFGLGRLVIRNRIGIRRARAVADTRHRARWAAAGSRDGV